MWRTALFFGLIGSVTLNVYLFMQLNVLTIENKFQQEVRVHPQQRDAQMKKDKIKSIENVNDIDSRKRSQQVANKIKQSIDAKDYFNARFLINTLANDHEAELPEVRLFWLQATEALIQQKSFTHAEDSISAYLAFEPDDGDFLYLQVDLYWQQQLPLLAIKYAYEVQYHVYNEVSNRNAINYARARVQQHADVLISTNLWLELRDLVEEVIIFDPQSLNLQWLFVRAQFELGEFEYARNAIEPLLSEPNYKIKALALLAEIEAALRKPQSIPLSRQGEHFIVQALMNDTFKVSLMLDTGASISLLSEPAFEALSQYSEVTYIKNINLNTAGGTVTASIYQVAEFAIQGYIVNDFVFAVSPSYVTEGNDGLLGMNFLSAFDFHIDQNNSLLILKNK
ncbi:retropepsin-like aspartic protease [Colwellia sp. 12G3]|uniref:retropepsin-like aspartic protease n=1 Tax=Colwellia sp. 12G3 TaxID=2058299 RepID=UPI0012FEEB41|nr:retropepsin-like aspartic protease [Colwellia sp. 12G3]